jgi:broad specificity phosphatase PhoE
MITTVYFLRHAAYENPNQILPYRLHGFRLSKLGKIGTEKLAESLHQHSIEAVYASPLDRTRETAEIIAKKFNLSVLTDDRLLEVRSPLQGKPEGFTEAMGGWKIYDSDWYKRGGGETPLEIFSRMDSFMKEKVREHSGKEIIVVSHGDPIMIYIAGHQGKHLTAESLVTTPYIQMGQCVSLTFPA